MRDKIEKYKKMIEEHLAEMDVYKGDVYRAQNKFDNYENRRYLVGVIAAGENDRHDESAALAAVEELIPFLYEK